MTQNLNNFLTLQNSQNYATQNGTNTHRLLKQIIIDKDVEIGDKKLIIQIHAKPELQRFFVKNVKTQVAIAGIIKKQFISRRIDRLLIDTTNKIIEFIDYKTDVNKSLYIDKYTKQLNEYAQLLKSAYPDYKVIGYILWLRDWQLDKIIDV